MKETRHGPTIRQWKLLRLIYGNRYMTVPILAQKLECNPRTIRRDLLSLEAAGFPILTGPNPNDNYVRLERDWFLGAEPQQYVSIRQLERRHA